MASGGKRSGLIFIIIALVILAALAASLLFVPNGSKSDFRTKDTGQLRFNPHRRR